MPIIPDTEKSLQWGESWSLGKNLGQQRREREGRDQKKKRKERLSLCWIRNHFFSGRNSASECLVNLLEWKQGQLRQDKPSPNAQVWDSLNISSYFPNVWGLAQSGLMVGKFSWRSVWMALFLFHPLAVNIRLAHSLHVLYWLHVGYLQTLHASVPLHVVHRNLRISSSCHLCLFVHHPRGLGDGGKDRNGPTSRAALHKDSKNVSQSLRRCKSWLHSFEKIAYGEGLNLFSLAPEGWN